MTLPIILVDYNILSVRDVTVSTGSFQVMGIPRLHGHILTVIYSNIFPLNTKLFTK